MLVDALCLAELACIDVTYLFSAVGELPNGIVELISTRGARTTKMHFKRTMPTKIYLQKDAGIWITGCVLLEGPKIQAESQDQRVLLAKIMFTTFAACCICCAW